MLTSAKNEAVKFRDEREIYRCTRKRHASGRDSPPSQPSQLLHLHSLRSADIHNTPSNLQSGKTFCATFLRIFICGLKCSINELKLAEKLLSHVVFQGKIHFQVFQKRVRTRTKIGLAVQVSKTNTEKGHFW